MHTADTVNVLLGHKVLAEKYNTPMQFSAENVEFVENRAELSRLALKFDPYFVGAGNVSLPLDFLKSQKNTVRVEYQIAEADMRPIWQLLKEQFVQYGEKEYDPKSTWNAMFDITAGRIIVSDNVSGVCETVSAKGNWQNNILTVDDFFAVCAGETQVSYSGQMKPVEGLPKVEMALEFESKNLREFLSAMNLEVKSSSENVYKNSKLKADVAFSPVIGTVQNIRLDLDESQITGQLSAQFATKKYDAQLKADRFNFDAYMPATAEKETFNAWDTVQHDLAWLNDYKDYKFELIAEIENAALHKVSAQNVIVNAAYENDEFALLKLQSDNVLNTSIQLSGLLKNISQKEPEIDVLTYNLKTQNLPVLAEKIGISLPDWEIWKQKNLLMNGELSGNIKKINIKANMQADADKFAYDGLLKQSDDELLFDGLAELKSQKLENLMQKMNLNIENLKFFRGVFNGKTHIKGDKNNFKLDDFEFLFGPVKSSGNMQVSKNKAGYAFKGEVNLSELNLEQLLNAQKVKTNAPMLKGENTFFARPDFGRMNFDFSAYKDTDIDIKLSADKAVYNKLQFKDFSTRLLSSAEDLKAEMLSFGFDESKVSGNLTVTYAIKPRVSGNIAISNVNLVKKGGSIYTISAEKVNFASEFEANATSVEDIMTSFSGKLTVEMPSVSVGGIDLASIEQDLLVRQYSKGLFQVMQNNLKNGQTNFGAVKAEILAQNGVLVLGKIDLSNASVNVLLGGDINLKDWRINTKASVTYGNLPNIAPFDFMFTGALNSPSTDVSVEKIVRKYDTHWQEVAAREQAQKDEAERLLNEKRKQTETEIAKLSDKHTAVMARLEDYNGKNLAEETDEHYQNQNKRLDEIGGIIQGLETKTSQADFAEDDATEIHSKVMQLQEELESINSKLDLYFTDDMEQALKSLYEKMEQYKGEYANIDTEFEQMYKDDLALLRQIGAEQYITDNSDVQEAQAQMAELKAAVARQIKDFAEKFTQTNTMEADKDKLAAVHSLIPMPDEVLKNYKKMKEIRAKTADLLLQIINQRQEIYSQKQLEQERKKQKEAAENAGNLLIEDAVIPHQSKTEVGNSGLAKIIQADEIKNSPAKQDEDFDDSYLTLRPIGDSQPKAAASGAILRSYGTSEEKESQTSVPPLLKPADGPISRATGTIIVR